MIITEKPKAAFLLDSQHPLEDVFNTYTERNLVPIKSYCIPIYFYRYIGIQNDENNYLEKLKILNKNLQNSSSPYLKITKGLNKNFSQEEIENAKKIWSQYSNWKSNLHKSYIDLYNLEWINSTNNSMLDWTIKRNFTKIIHLFDATEKNNNETIRMNFAISILSWTNRYIPSLFSTVVHKKEIPKFIFWGPIKRNEAYFLIYLSTLGCDVLYINPTEDKELSRIDPQCIYSKLIEYDKKAEILDFPEIEEKMKQVASFSKDNKIENQIMPQKNTTQIEKSFEDLAKLSTSVVMIHVYNTDFIPYSSASGVVIDEDGLIVTNYHVVKGGSVFGIVFENNKSEFISHKIIQYNETSDLALLQIDLKTKPIPIKFQDSLKRGQQIVAIGSPLGLMNTISDGIVAGFRNFGNQNYIQITAPISPGSSGGALLDKYGYLVGITTGGYIEGQNINLAVPSCEIIKMVNESL